ncbi:MAG TPA: hypothetical protein VNZ53_56320 [Steroidobacteraceae bacterium]|jgi:hypothetical protein|nr:hypothetical protein [Steroidobacteraceae bacterium]
MARTDQFTIEKSVQTLFEKNMEALLAVRFLASEFTTTNGGRIDTLARFHPHTARRQPRPATVASR